MSRTFLLVITTFVVVSTSAVAAPPPETVAPVTTVELAVAPNLDLLEAQFGRTQLARIYHDPSTQAFFDGHGAELFGLFELPDAIGLKWDTLKALAGGPLASASIPLPDRQLGTVVMLDVTGHKSAAQSALTSAAGKAKQAGIGIRDQTVAGVSISVWALPDVPGRQRPVGVLVKDDMLLVADPPETLGPLLSTWGDLKRSLAGTTPYQAVRGRTAMKPGEP